MTRRRSPRRCAKLHEQGIAFTVDVLGETVVSEAEADQYAQRYLDV